MDHPTLLLLHGLGATKSVWDGVVDRWPGDAVAVDLPGHGSAQPLSRYSFGALAAGVDVDPKRCYVAVGHSLGGVVALTLATGWFGLHVAGVVGVGIKVVWTQEDRLMSTAQAGRPARVFEQRAEAEAWALKLAGLSGGVADPESVRETEGGWRATFDPAAFGVGVPDMAGLRRAADCPVVLAAGERDPMCSAADLAGLVDDPVELPGLGHNAHVEDPGAVLALVDRLDLSRP